MTTLESLIARVVICHIESARELSRKNAESVI
jgi:hypothetical protein